MRIIIIGASKVGYALAERISREGYDLVVIDRDQEKIDGYTDSFDCNGFVGNGGNPELLKKAGIDSASVFIALTKEDETNIMCCSVAKSLGVAHTIAAVRGPEYNDDSEFFAKQLGVDVMINPDQAAAQSIRQLIRYSGAVDLEEFANGAIRVATVDVGRDSILAGLKLTEVQKSLEAQVLICGINRKGKVITPKGESQIRIGDRVTFAAVAEEMEKTLAKLCIVSKLVKKAVIVGGSKVGCYLADQLMEDGVKVTMVDRSQAKCHEILEHFPRLNIINGNGMDVSFLERELKDADACVAVTDQDEENLIISMYAKAYGLERIAAEIDNRDYETMLSKSGVSHVFSTQNAVLSTIIQNIRRMGAPGSHQKDNSVLQKFYSLDGGKVEAAEFEVGDDFKLTGMEFKSPQFALKPGILIAVILRDGKAFVPDGRSVIQKGDHVIVVAADHTISRLADIVA